MLAFIWAALNIPCVYVTSVCHIGTEFESSIFSRDYLKFGGECEELFLQEHICIRVLLRSPRLGFFTLDNTQRKHVAPWPHSTYRPARTHLRTVWFSANSFPREEKLSGLIVLYPLLSKTFLKHMRLCLCSSEDLKVRLSGKEKSELCQKEIESRIYITVEGIDPPLDNTEMPAERWLIHFDKYDTSFVMGVLTSLKLCEELRLIWTSLSRLKIPAFHFQHRSCLFSTLALVPAP